VNLFKLVYLRKRCLQSLSESNGAPLAGSDGVDEVFLLELLSFLHCPSGVRSLLLSGIIALIHSPLATGALSSYIFSDLLSKDFKKPSFPSCSGSHLPVLFEN